MKTRHRGCMMGALLCLATLINCATNVHGQSVPVPSPDDVALLKWYGADQASVFNYGGSPTEFAFDGQDLWIVLQTANQLIKVRTSDGAILQTISVPSPTALLYDGFRLWVLSLGGGSGSSIPAMIEIQANDGAVLGQWFMGLPQGLAFDGINTWSLDLDDGYPGGLEKHNPGDLSPNSILVYIATPGLDRTALTFDGNRIWVALPDDGHNGGDQLAAYDLAGNLLYNCPTGYLPVAMAFDGANVWSYNSGDGTLTKCLASSGEALATIKVDEGYRYLGEPAQIAFDGANIWIPNAGTNQVTKIQASNGAIVGRFPVNGNPRSVAFDGVNIWVASPGNGTVTKM